MRKDNVTDLELTVWFHHYVKNSEPSYDVHNQFAKDLNITRNEAKVLCYTIAHKLYSSFIMKGYYEER